jgi:hypothetical protein
VATNSSIPVGTLGGVVRIVGGAPGTEELAALTAVLQAVLSAPPIEDAGVHGTGHRKAMAPWTAPRRHRPVSCWLAA